MNVTKISREEVATRALSHFPNYGHGQKVYGVPRGGTCALLYLLASQFQLVPVTRPQLADVILDDIIDSGKTRDAFATPPATAVPFIALVDKQGADKDIGWVVFPWEKEEGPEDAVVRLLEWIGEDPRREGLRETPGRVLKAFKEMTGGYQEDPAVIMSKVFEESYDEMVLVRGVPFVSLCEHHLLPFIGEAHVGYIPSIREEEKTGNMTVKWGVDRVVGLSKLARLVDCYARRLQVQERMTRQIAQAIQDNLNPRGVGVVVKATHSCLACRGAKKTGVSMVTSAMLGVLREKPEARAEFLALCGGN